VVIITSNALLIIEIPPKKAKWKFSKGPFSPLSDLRHVANYSAEATAIVQDTGIRHSLFFLIFST
jgi:hypothetical protein